MQFTLQSGSVESQQAGESLQAIKLEECMQIAAVTGARSEIVSILRRRKREEASEKVLKSMKLRSSTLPWAFHLQDMRGKGLLEQTVHGNNIVVRCCKV
jgi:DNA-directed RNA polymerase subunit H (RpoH/RPB5)